MKPITEAKMLTNALFEEWGTRGYAPYGVPYVDGKDAILWMKDRDLSWREVEWAGFYLKHKMQELALEKYPEHFQKKTEGKCYLVEGEYLWDTRLRDIKTSEELILFGVEQLDSFVEEYGGIGIILVNAHVEKDETGEFYQWIEKLKGGSSEYTKKREKEGRPQRKRKEMFFTAYVNVYYFPKELFLGEVPAWIDDEFQKTMRQQDGDSRSGKYRIKLKQVPEEYLLFLENFNFDREDFEKEFGDPDIYE